MGNGYGAIVREILSNVKYVRESEANNLHEMQDYAMEKLHSPLQSMMKSGFRASRSAFAGVRGQIDAIGLRDRAIPPQSHTMPAGPMSVPPGLAYGTTQVVYQAARYTSAPPTRVDRPTTYEYMAERYTTSMPHSEITRPTAYSYKYTATRSGAASVPAMLSATETHVVTASVLDTVIENSIAGSDHQRDSIRSSPKLGPGHRLLQTELANDGMKPTDGLLTTPILPALPIIRDLLPDVPRSGDQVLADLEGDRQAILSLDDPERRLVWADETLDWSEIAMMGKMWVARSLTQTAIINSLRADAVYVISFLAHQHHPKAEFLKGLCLEFGKLGHAVGKKEAYHCYQRASQNGNARATFRIGVMFELSQNHLKAAQHYQKGVDAGDSASLYRFGMMLLRGQHGQLQNYERGVSLIRASALVADHNAPQGAYMYGMLLAHQLPHLDVPEKFLPKDLDGARLSLKRAAFFGFAKAQTQMAIAYGFGRLKCEFNPALSLHYAVLAAAQGEKDAEMLVSKWFLCGAKGHFETNEAAAFVYAQRAARSGLATAEFAMGYFHEVGIHVSIDMKAALAWYNKAAAKGNKDAIARCVSLA